MRSWISVLWRLMVSPRPSVVSEKKGGGTMLQRRRLSLVLVMAILLVLPATAVAGLTLNYEGSLKIPRRSSSPTAPAN